MRKDFSVLELERYARQIDLPTVGLQGQERLAAASILIVGCGGIGSPAAIALAAIGVGKIGLVDHDKIELSNLHRQHFYSEEEIGKHKTEVLESRIRALNSNISVSIFTQKVDLENIEEIASDYQIVLDGTDNLAARQILNAYCVAYQKPFIYGSIYQNSGFLSYFSTPKTACYHCLHPYLAEKAGNNCSDAGVLGTIPSIIGQLQATMTVNQIVNLERISNSILISVNFTTFQTMQMRLEKEKECAICSYPAKALTAIKQLISIPDEIPEISSVELKRMLDSDNPPLLLDVREEAELIISALPNILHIPMYELPGSIVEYPKEKDIVVICRSGRRSASVVKYLNSIGYSGAINLAGGMNAYSREVDSSIAIY